MNRFARLIVVTCLSVASLIPSCTSRYRLSLYLTADNTRRKVKVEQTRFISGCALAGPTSETKVVDGDANCLVITTGARGETQTTGTYNALKFDEYFRCVLYIQLPAEVRVMNVPLTDHSFAQILGRYDVPPDDKTFLPSSGSMMIDSLVSGRMFATVKAEFKNPRGAALIFDGQFKAKVSD